MAIVDDLGLPAALLDPAVSVDTIVQRFPELAAELRRPACRRPADATTAERTTRRAVPARRGRGTPRGAGLEAAAQRLRHRLRARSAPAQLARWQSDAGWFEQALGCEPGELRAGHGRPGRARRQPLGEPGGRPGHAGCTCARCWPTRRWPAQLTPSMSLIEQLLRDKANLSGRGPGQRQGADPPVRRRGRRGAAHPGRSRPASGTIDRSVPPKRVFRNLDLERTIWKNLTNWSPEDERLYVDRLFYRQTAKRDHAGAADRGGRPVRLDGRLDGQLHHPRVDLRRAAEGGRAPDRVRHPGARPDAVGARPVRGAAAHQPRRRHRRPGRDGAGPAEDRRPAQHRRWSGSPTSTSSTDRSRCSTASRRCTAPGCKFIPVGSVSSSRPAERQPLVPPALQGPGHARCISGHIRKLVVRTQELPRLGDHRA